MQNEINELRNQIRTLKRVLYTLCGAGVLGGLLAATNLNTVPDVIQAKKFEVVNDAGKVIVELRNLRGGGVDNGQLVTRISTGGTLVELGAGPGGGLVLTQNGKGGTLVELGTTVDGEGLVATENGKGKLTSQTP